MSPYLKHMQKTHTHIHIFHTFKPPPQQQALMASPIVYIYYVSISMLATLVKRNEKKT